MNFKNGRLMDNMLLIGINTCLFLLIITVFCELPLKAGCGYSLILAFFLSTLQSIEKSVRVIEIIPIPEVKEEVPVKQVL